MYGRERLGAWWGFVAGWSFVIGKIASSAAMALTFAAYAAPVMLQRPLAAAVVIMLVAVNVVGVTRTAAVTRVIVALSVLGLGTAVVAAWASGEPHHPLLDGIVDHGVYGILQSAGLLFFAFAGYARIATMGEEVRDPARTIPRAITLALLFAVVIYGIVAVTILVTLGAAGVAESADPLARAAAFSGWPGIEPVVRITAAVASLGALLGLVAGIGRTTLAMARRSDLPSALARVGQRLQTPWVAEVSVGVIVLLLAITVDLRGAIGFSSFGVLVYYFIANLSAWTQRGADRRYPRALQLVGLVGCVALVVTLPWQAIAIGTGVILVGIAARALTRAARTPATPDASPGVDPSRHDRPHR